MEFRRARRGEVHGAEAAVCFNFFSTPGEKGWTNFFLHLGRPYTYAGKRNMP